MKKLFFLTIAVLSFVFAEAQKRVLDESVYDSWKTIKSFLVSDDANITFTEYESFSDKSTLDIKIRNISFALTVKGGKDAKFFNGQKAALYLVKDTLFTVNAATGETKRVGVSKKYEISDDSPFIAWYEGKILYYTDISTARIDSAVNVSYATYSPSGEMLLISSSNNKRALLRIFSQGKNRFKRDTLLITEKHLSEISVGKNGETLIFFQADDSLGKTGVKAVLYDLKKKRLNEAGLDEKKLPSGTVFNFKKGIQFSKNFDYYKFEVNPAKEEAAEVKKEKPIYEYELWRWNDTLLPSQRRTRESVFANQLKCLYDPSSGKLVQLSYGKGVFLMPDDNSNFGFELDNKPYMYTDLWEDPLPRDFYFVNRKTGEYKLLFEAFMGSFAISNTTDNLFTYEYDKEAWIVTNLNTLEKRDISSAIPHPIKNLSFDKPQPASPYGQAGMTADNRYFLVYDEFDVWALPLDSSKDAVCITGGYGRENNIRFKVINISGGRTRDEGVDLKKEILLESVNYNNMYSGFYTLQPGKKPELLTEGPQKFKFVKRSGKSNYIIQIENFSQAPDYWLVGPDITLKERLTDLNEQTKDYKFGKTEYITWSDSKGAKQTGILYTPEDYDPAKKYPMIVYFYETMSQDIFMFYPPAPTTSTINPAMFVSRGYVVFMPDIRYEIGWPGQSCLNIVESGTKHLIDKGVADPERIGVQGHSWGGYQVAYLITQTDIFKCACSETAVANMTSAYTGLRAGAGKPRMFMYESSQSRIGGTLWDRQQNYIQNSPIFFLDKVTTPLLSRHSDGDEAVPYSQGLELFLGLKRLGKEVWMFNYKGDGHNIKKRDIAVDWSRRMDEYFDYYLMGSKRPVWMN